MKSLHHCLTSISIFKKWHFALIPPVFLHELCVSQQQQYGVRKSICKLCYIGCVVSSSRWSFSSSPAATTNGSSLEVSLFSLSLDELEVREGGDPEMGCLKDGGVHYTENTDYITIHIQSLDGSSENKAHQCTLWAISVAKIQQK